MTTMPSQNDRPPIAPGNLAGAALENGRYEIDVRLGSGSMGHVYRESSRRSGVRPAGRGASSGRRSAVRSTTPRRNSASGLHASSSQFEESSNSYTGVHYAVTKISRGGSGRVPCPSCGKNIKLKFKHAGRRGICNNCGSRLLISDDLTTLKLLRPVKPGMVLHPQMQMVTLPDHSSQDDLVLGTSLFGLKLGIRLAIGLGAVLIVFLIGLTIYMTAKAVERQQEQQQATQRYKSTE